MALDVVTTIVIERPIGYVSEYAGDPGHAPEWSRRVESAEWRTEPPITLGSQITLRAKFAGRRVALTYDVIECSPGEQVAMRTTGGWFPVDTTSTWRPVGDRVTHMTLRNQGTPSGLARLVVPLMSIVVRRMMRRDLAQLKQLLESRPA